MNPDADDVAALDPRQIERFEGFVGQDGVTVLAGVAAASPKSHRGVITPTPNEIWLGLTRCTVIRKILLDAVRVASRQAGATVLCERPSANGRGPRRTSNNGRGGLGLVESAGSRAFDYTPDLLSTIQISADELRKGRTAKSTSPKGWGTGDEGTGRRGTRWRGIGA